MIKKKNNQTPFQFLQFARRAVSATIVFMVIAGCQQNSGQQESEEAPLTPSDHVKVVQAADVSPTKEAAKEPPMKKAYPYRGTVQYFNLEGGFYGIVTDKGLKLLPSGLPKEYLQDGAIIEFSGEIQKGVLTIQQWGTPFSIKSVNLIEPGKPGNTERKELQ
jgi:hypothetical protein